MGRPPRLVADGLVYHALNRGNNRARVFAHPADFRQFLEALGQTQERYPFRLYAYCLMGNHFHLVVEPDAGQNVEKMVSVHFSPLPPCSPRVKLPAWEDPLA